MEITLRTAVEIVGGVPSQGNLDQALTSVVIDSRKAIPGSLFVAFAGENVDGHDFLEDCARRGALAALVERDVPAPPGLVTIRVSNTLRALQNLAARQRHNLDNLHVLGVTGSSGKTTTKELIAGILSQGYSVLKTQGNLNNEIGLPLTMFEINPGHQWAVLEMGMNAPGEITTLCSISRPGIGVITNIGVAHFEHMGSREAILNAKFELAQGLVPPAILILNGDDELQRRRAREGLPGVERVLFYGLEEGNDVRGAAIESNLEGSNFDVYWQGKKFHVSLPLPGRHNVSNALAACTAGLALGISPEKIARGLAGTMGEKRRLQTFEVAGMTVIDDSYNANPDSTARALEILGQYPQERRKVAFLGDMLELGPIAPAEHRLIGAAAAKNGVDFLVAVGKYAEYIRQGAVEGGLSRDLVLIWPDSNTGRTTPGFLESGDVILVKGSLGVKMDVIVQILKDGGLQWC